MTRTVSFVPSPRLVMAAATSGLVALASAGTALLVLTGTSVVAPAPSAAPPLPAQGPAAARPAVVVVPSPPTAARPADRARASRPGPATAFVFPVRQLPTPQVPLAAPLAVPLPGVALPGLPLPGVPVVVTPPAPVVDAEPVPVVDAAPDAERTPAMRRGDGGGGDKTAKDKKAAKDKDKAAKDKTAAKDKKAAKNKPSKAASADSSSRPSTVNKHRGKKGSSASKSGKHRRPPGENRTGRER